MDAFFISAGSVLLAEMGDKTQFLTLCFTLRHPCKLTLMLGIFIACVLNHLLSSVVGLMISQWLPPPLMALLFGVGFIIMGLLLLRPDKAEEDCQDTKLKFGLLCSVVVIFFLAETGDKTQLATMLLAAQYQGALAQIVTGSTLGMMLANIPVIYLGAWFLKKVPMQLIRTLGALLFLVLGALSLLRYFQVIS